MNKVMTSVLAVGAGIAAYNYAKKQIQTSNEKNQKGD